MKADNAKKWVTFTIACPENIVEAVSDQLGVMSGTGVEIRPQNSSAKQKVTGYFILGENGPDQEVKTAAARMVDQVSEELAKLFAIYNLVLPDPETSIIEDQDWATSWQQFFTAFEIVSGLVIKPSWEEYTPAVGQQVITMDPGMAFGTGQHSSTRLALSLLASCFKKERENNPGRILDIGTGTGILAMAAALYGADQIMAIDNDPEAVTVAQHNVQANHFDWNIGISARALEDLTGPYDLISANIVHDVLVDMSPTISRLASAGAHVILSGILAGDQEKNLQRLYHENGMELVLTEHDEEWAALLLQKSS